MKKIKMLIKNIRFLMSNDLSKKRDIKFIGDNRMKITLGGKPTGVTKPNSETRVL